VVVTGMVAEGVFNGVEEEVVVVVFVAVRSLLRGAKGEGEVIPFSRLRLVDGGDFVAEKEEAAAEEEELEEEGGVRSNGSA